MCVSQINSSLLLVEAEQGTILNSLLVIQYVNVVAIFFSGGGILTNLFTDDNWQIRLLGLSHGQRLSCSSIDTFFIKVLDGKLADEIF